MSVHVKLKKVILTTWIQYTIFITLFNLFQASPLYPRSGDWTCNAGRVLRDQTLNAGIEAGQFKKVGTVKDISQCIQFCCNEVRCNVAFMAKGICYLVSCNNQFLCRPVPAKSVNLNPQLAYVTHHKLRLKDTNTQALKTFMKSPPSQTLPLAYRITPHFYKDVSAQERTFINPLVRQQFKLPRATIRNKSGDKRVIIQKDSQKDQTSKAELFFSEQNNLLTAKPPVIVKSDKCFPARIFTSVSLKYGPDSGDFYDYGKIGDMRQCVDLCCKDKLCDVSFMVEKTCYTVSCYSFEKCQMIPASRQATLPSQLAYVIKKRDIAGKEKLKISKKHENLLQMQRDQERYLSWKFDRDRQRLYEKTAKKESNEKQDGEEPNVPDSLTRHCQHNKVMKNHVLIGGQKAGIYTFRGLTPGFHACLSLCCADLFCDAAFLLGKRCYSVQCYKNGKCASRAVKAGRLQSMLAFVERPDVLDISEKRTSIPGLLPTGGNGVVVAHSTRNHKIPRSSPHSGAN
ncbi:uncharacterized protein LOC130641823 isoform X2 [Hydractinia symbiolongicarpus]|uniref:uncharacterized protein LOC130641823 isoform X2 n=1 Tax=Hydractinia symbiolongicarpus TaxID=13093 RepID=UPI00254D872E|nr:uncharacterized protein LOC130641823 isoform X2 [Hydractinia symbiolongicarpus]